MPAPSELRRRWAELATTGAAQTVTAGFLTEPPPAVRFGPSPSVAVSPGSRLSPPGWCGIVTIDGEVIATAPDEDAASLLRAFLIAAPPEAWTDPDAARALLPVADVLGPAVLAYLDPAAFRPAPGPVGAEPLGALLAAAGPDEAGESGLADAEQVFTVADDAGRVVAAGGYERWPGGLAHVCVLTHPAERGRGHGRRAASAAVAAALAEGLRPQWRARPEPSRRLAAALGFAERGAQLSLRLTPTR
ncbi:GNAT family N-acetyltransferase [Spirilliplanes yamanashiensis]|uniref:GNAT family N-acetyltransferase n=1 Tax=Spirilliplanes yamanashiensis TaxID=42233 RepID=UPI0031D4CB8E